MLTWFPREQFWRMFDAKYRSKQRHLSAWFELEMSLPDLRGRIQEPPVFTPAEEDDDFPGPVECWYGGAGEHLFMLVYNYQAPSASTIVQHEASEEATREVRSHLHAFKVSKLGADRA